MMPNSPPRPAKQRRSPRSSGFRKRSRQMTLVASFASIVSLVGATASEYLQELLGVTPGAQPATTGRRSAHLQLRLLADNPEAAAAVELFAIHSLGVGSEGRGIDVSHYGGPLENADDAVLRAYVYA